ncbi:MAG: vWA domain-containing protein [Steroidobacteraceae bacterium]
MKLRRRDTEVFSLSFLDCICCGFGAIILLLVLTEFDQPVVLERSRADMAGQVNRLQDELFIIRGETDQLNRELKGRIVDLTRERARLARIQGDLTDVKGEFAASNSDAKVANIVETQMVAAYQELTAEMERLLKQPQRRAPTGAVGGIPVDSEYVVFVIDTSNSMVTFHWEAALDIMKETLDIYPDVKGMQVLNDQGRYMFESSRGQWLTDSRETRQRIQNTMKNWRPYSESNPMPGILQALTTYRAAGRKVSIYVIGDEFTGDSMQQALDRIDSVNKADPKRPRVRIHTIGFPEGPGFAPFTNIRFSALMRAIAARNDGTFVGLTTEKPCRQFVEVLGAQQCIGQ